MKYAMLIYPTPGSHEALPRDEQAAVDGEYMALRRDPRCVTGAHLQPVETATTLRLQDGKALTTDGPYADTKEFFGGYFVFDVDDLDRGTRARGPDSGGADGRRDRGPSSR